MKDNKYIVFKREDWERFVKAEHEDPWGAAQMISGMVLDDAVVIRTKDPLAGPALHAYAAMAAMPARLIDPEWAEATKLLAVADYFHARAVEADEFAASNPTRLPD